MAVEAGTVLFTYAGDSASVQFGFPAKFLSASDILVALDGAVQGTGYVVVGAGEENGGYVLFVTAPATGVVVSLLRVPPLSQLVDFVNGQTVLEGVLDTGLDKLTMIAQYLKRQQERSIRLSPFDPATFDPLPGVSDRENKFLSFDSTGAITLGFDAGMDQSVIIASMAEALAGTNDSHFMTPAKVRGVSATYDTLAALQSASVNTQVFAVRTRSYATAGDLGGADYVRVDSEPPHPGKVRSADGQWWELSVAEVSVRQLGAVPSDSVSCYTECVAAKDAARALQVPLYFPGNAGEYLWDLQGGNAGWDLTVFVRGAHRAIPVRGDGATTTSIRLVNAVGMGWYIRADNTGTHWFNPNFNGLTVRASNGVPAFTIGRNDLLDYVNMAYLHDMSVENGYDNANTIACRLNGVYGGVLNLCRMVSYALANEDNELVAVNGVGLQCRQAEFITLVGGGYGNANAGIQFASGVNGPFTVVSSTLENVNYCVLHQSSGSGHVVLLTPQMTNILVAGLRNDGMLTNARIVVYEPNIAGGTSTGVDETAYDGIVIKDRSGVATPTAPATGAPVANKSGRDVRIHYWGPATVTGIVVDGFERGITATSGGFWLRAGGTCLLNYTGALAWQWENAS